MFIIQSIKTIDLSSEWSITSQTVLFLSDTICESLSLSFYQIFPLLFSFHMIAILVFEWIIEWMNLKDRDKILKAQCFIDFLFDFKLATVDDDDGDGHVWAFICRGLL